MKPWYFKGDCPVCTRSASCFSRNHLNFVAHAMCVKLWYHAKFQPFHSSFILLFNFRVIQRKKIIKSMKNSKWSYKMFEIWGCGFERCIMNAKKVWSWNKFKKWNAFLTHEFSSETLILRRTWSSLYTKCIQFLS